MSTVRTQLDLRLLLAGDGTVEVPASLRYAADDPYAVTAVFRTPDGDVTWVFARDLLVDGMATATGEGDVTVWPSTTDEGRPALCLSLSSPGGAALLLADPAVVRRFLDATFSLVPVGAEAGHLDLDAALVRLLGGEHSR